MTARNQLSDPANGPTGSSTAWQVPAAFLGVALAALTGLAVVASGPIDRGSVDARGHDLALDHRTPALVESARLVTDLGSGRVVAPLTFAAVLALAAPPLRHRVRCAALALGVLATGSLARLGLSVLIGRQRPPASDWAATAGGYAFPSGHTTGSALAAGVLAWTATQRFAERRSGRAAAWSIAILFAAAVGTTRIYLGVHWPTDVLGGWALATAWLSGCLPVLRRYAQRRGRRVDSA